MLKSANVDQYRAPYSSGVGDHPPFQVELVEHSPGALHTGIGRYTRQLYHHLAQRSDRMTIRLTSTIAPPLAGRFSFLRHLPPGIRDHHAGSIVHFMQIMGCAQMLWGTVRPAVATVHDLGGLVWNTELRKINYLDRVLFTLSLAGLRRMNAVLAVSEFTRQSVIKHLPLPPERVHTVYSGVDLTLFRPIPDARQQLSQRYPLPGPRDARYVLYVGSELPRKNLETLLRAMAIVRQEQRNMYLLKVGKSGGEPFRAHTLRLLRNTGLSDCVHFYEDVPDVDLPLFYGASDVYVCPSLLEGFGFPVVEAMACGTPVICSNTSALPEITGAAALLIQPTHAAALAEAMLNLLNDARLRAQLVDRGLRRSTAFAWQRTVEGVLDVYQQVANNRRNALDTVG